MADRLEPLNDRVFYHLYRRDGEALTPIRLDRVKAGDRLLEVKVSWYTDPHVHPRVAEYVATEEHERLFSRDTVIPYGSTPDDGLPTRSDDDRWVATVSRGPNTPWSRANPVCYSPACKGTCVPGKFRCAECLNNTPGTDS